MLDMSEIIQLGNSLKDGGIFQRPTPQHPRCGWRCVPRATLWQSSGSSAVARHNPEGEMVSPHGNQNVTSPWVILLDLHKWCQIFGILRKKNIPNFPWEPEILIGIWNNFSRIAVLQG